VTETNIFPNMQLLETIEYHTSPNCNIQYNIHCNIQETKNNKAKPTYAKHILHNRHEYGTMDTIMTLRKTLSNTSLLTHYENFFKKSHHEEGESYFWT